MLRLLNSVPDEPADVRLSAKSVWSYADFEMMGWHDNAVHGWAWEPWDPGRPGENALVLDLDYIVD